MSDEQNPHANDADNPTPQDPRKPQSGSAAQPPDGPNQPPNDPTTGENEDATPDDIPASTLFIEMMRRAAQQHTASTAENAADGTAENAAENAADGTAENAAENAAEKSASQKERPAPPALPPIKQVGDKGVMRDPAKPQQPPASYKKPAQRPKTDDEDQPAASATPNERRQATQRQKPDPDQARKPASRPTKPQQAASAAKQANGQRQKAASQNAEQQYAQKLEAQRIQRVKRRQARRQQQRAGVFGGFVRTLFISIIAAGLASTIFTWFTAPDFITPSVAGRLQQADIAESTPTRAPTAAPTPNYFRRVGVVSGHRGPQNPPDPGAVCPDGLTEAEINFAVATLLVNQLRARGYQVDLLDEFDPRLQNYKAAALVSVHANSCIDYGAGAGSGFLVSQAASRPKEGADNDLAECIATHYGHTTQLQRLYSLTLDMTEYHTFGEIHELTPAAIIELGFMLRDRELLTGGQDVIAQGIMNGIMCFLEPQNAPYVPPTPTPSATPTATPAP